jgi:DNA (cytosine-5)-methyltransferase 1
MMPKTTDPFVVDLFAGGGGASEGIRRALGVSPYVAVNHDEAAILMHAANHPGTIHLTESVWRVSPSSVVGRRQVDLLWASPDCTHFSRAKGGKPRSQEIRSLAWVVVEWARIARPRVICLENVPEFTTWGPLDEQDQPIKERAGETFRLFVGRLEMLGYRVEWRVLVACDYGAPTSRKRLFLVARCDGEAIRWPEPTHGPGRPHPWRTAAECIDWSIPCPSIFDRARPLAPATERRIAEGIRRYVLGGRPFLVNLSHGGRVENLDEPARTVTATPIGTVTAVDHHSLATVFLSRQFRRSVGSDIDAPVPTVMPGGGGKTQLAACFLDKLHGSAVAGQPLDIPAPTVAAGGGRGGGHAALVAAFLMKYYGTGGQWAGADELMHTLVSKARMGLVTVAIKGEEYALVDIGMRMLQPRELARAQGFPDSYVLTGSKAQQVARVGNSVPPDVVAAIVAANVGPRSTRRAA